ncbi:MAG: aspartate/glutamate racemase family protein [Anaerolineae bacterium]
MSPENKTAFVLHTSLALVDLLKGLFQRELPAVRMVNIVDDSLLADVRAAGGLTPSVVRRMVGYALLAQSAGADALFNACSSVGEAADMIRQVIDIPVVKIDEPMAAEAAARGERIAVVATVPTTLDPTIRLIERQAAAAGRSVSTARHLVEGAFDVLVSGDAARHDRMVTERIEQAAQAADVVVLAQASMARLVPQLAGRLPVPVLASPESGVRELKRVLDQSNASARHAPTRASCPAVG